MSLADAQALMSANRDADAYTLFNREYANGNKDVNVRLGTIACLMKLNKFVEAIEFAKISESIEPECLINLVQCFEKLGKKDEMYATLLKLLDLRQTRMVGLYRKTVVVAQERKDWNTIIRAITCLQDIEVVEELPLLYGLADAYSKAGRTTQAIAYYLMLLDRAESDAERLTCHAALAGIYKDSGLQAKAMEHFLATSKLSQTAEVMSNHIMMLQYAEGYSLASFYEKTYEYSLKHLRHLPAKVIPASRFDPNKVETGLNIAFVGGDFCGHSLGNLLLQPFLSLKEAGKNHRFAIYMRRKDEDAVSIKYRNAVHLWHNVHTLSNEALANKVLEDEVDVLIDTSGHTALNNMAMFGYRPAPVQAGWISGMMTPSGLPEVSYFLTDPYMIPKEFDKYGHEKLYELPSAFSYFPLAVDVPSVNPLLPYDKSGHVNFGSFNNPCKIGPSVMAAWATAMQRVPNSVLHVKLYSQMMAQRVITCFGRYGISADRIKVVYTFPKTEDVMRYYTDNIDIVLDTWPCAGMLTSAEAMWMGCPIATVRGNTFLHNQSWSCLSQVGLTDWGCDSVAAFPEMVRSLCLDMNKVRDIRNKLRTMMGAAPMRNPAKIASAVISSVEDMWHDRCAKHAKLRSILAPIPVSKG